MIIGILDADDLNDEVIQRYGTYPDMVCQLLSKAGPQLTFQTYQVTEQEYPQNINDCDAYLITGSKSSCYEDVDWINQLKQFVIDCVDQEKKLVGICFGHQLIAQALGGSVQKNNHGWGVGITSSIVTQTPHWLLPKQAHYNLLVSHQDQVTQLPRQASLIATNDFCPIASYIINESILAFQGHPEFTPDYLHYLMAKRRQIIGEKTYQQALESLAKPADHQLVAKWIVRFVKQSHDLNAHSI